MFGRQSCFTFGERIESGGDFGGLANKSFDVVSTQAILGIVAAGHVELGVDVVVAAGPHLVVVIDDRAADVKQRDHFGHVGIDHERVHFAGGLENVHAFAGDPVVLEIAPGATNDVAVDRSRVTVAAENAGAGDSEEVHPLAVDRVEEEGAEPDVWGLGNPEAIVVGESGEGEVGDGEWSHTGF